MFIFIPAAGFVFYKAYLGSCKRPVENSTVMWYKILQACLCVLWLVLSIINSGCFDGWMRISILKKHDDGAARFCIFLTVLESLGYTACFFLGILGIFEISSVISE